MKPAVAYMRFSSHSQTEMSIEGQRKRIQEYARQNDYTIVREYIDRALSGTHDRRPQFQKMLSDSTRQKFEYVIVYSLDRFARDRYDSAINKAHLKKHGVRVISATENISDDPMGIMVEGVLESMAEYYSAELSQKVRRGIALSVEQCKYIGGFIPLGYKVDENKHYQIDNTAPVVQKIYGLYAAGYTLRQINEAIIEQFGKAYFGNISNSINRILDNPNYKGIYTRGGAEVAGGMPRIIDDALWERVAHMRAKKRKSPTSKIRNDAEYLLTTKLFCGFHGRDPDKRVMMVGVSGTSKSGKIHSYYTCKSVWNKKGCIKRNVKKEYIESFILNEARKQLTDDNIAYIAKAIAEKAKQHNKNPVISDLKKKLKENDKAIENLMKAIESGEHMDILSERITQKRKEKAELEKVLAREQWDNTEITEDDIGTFLIRLKNGDENDIKYKRALIAIFVNAVYLYDDRATIFFNAIDRQIEVDYNILNGDDNPINNNGGECSYNQPTAPPFCYKSELMPIDDGFGFVRFVKW